MGCQCRAACPVIVEALSVTIRPSSMCRQAHEHEQGDILSNHSRLSCGASTHGTPQHPGPVVPSRALHTVTELSIRHSSQLQPRGEQGADAPPRTKERGRFSRIMAPHALLPVLVVAVGRGNLHGHDPGRVMSFATATDPPTMWHSPCQIGQ
eukprot:7161912-Prymnesium_polylepis.1